ncbi:MAG: thiamine-monophosphate kinase, partial [Alistipes sp.]|nr:thiamine-monophosphate kinase [Alistipes sp.]
MQEFEFIRHIHRHCEELPANGFEGIGDDCAVLELGDEALVFTADALMEGVHFLRHATSPRELGHKALAVNLSDVAAMGVRPVAVMLSISLPRDLDEGWSEAFIEGFTALAKQHQVALIGGDTTRSEQGIALSVTAIGRGPRTSLKRRREAHVGDTLLVTA